MASTTRGRPAAEARKQREIQEKVDSDDRERKNGDAGQGAGRGGG